MSVIMNCEFPSICWYSVNVQNVVEQNQLIYSAEEPKISPTYFDQANKYWDQFYRGWNSRPDKPGFLDKTLIGLLLEGFEEVADIQINVLNDIRHGVYQDENLYSDVERDRVETIGFKPIWSPGGFQV